MGERNRRRKYIWVYEISTNEALKDVSFSFEELFEKQFKRDLKKAGNIWILSM